MIACARLLALCNLARNRQAPMSIVGTIPSIKLIRLGHYPPLVTLKRNIILRQSGNESSMNTGPLASFSGPPRGLPTIRSKHSLIDQSNGGSNRTFGMPTSRSSRELELVNTESGSCPRASPRSFSGMRRSSSVEPQAALGVSVSLPSVIGAAGVERVLMPQLSGEEQAALHTSAQHIADATARLR